uniref:Uncharacterized protein n=1 Tax=Cyprinus carpio TaxID=7962 RepID=A0A8C2BR29_CYPCA
QQRTLVLAVTLGILQCCGWLSAQTVRTSVGMMGRGPEQWPMSHERVKRGWVWNQFFVVEEYTGTEPLYVGKVGLSVWAKLKQFLLRSYYGICMSLATLAMH